MIRKPLDLTPAVARAFVDDMRAYFAEEDKHKQDAIAVRQLNALREHQGPRERPPSGGLFILPLSGFSRSLVIVRNADASRKAVSFSCSCAARSGLHGFFGNVIIDLV
jgi:hypothetical protein